MGQTCKTKGIVTEDDGRWFCRVWKSEVKNRISRERFRIKKMIIVCFHLSLLILFESGSKSVSSQGVQVATINPQISSSPNYFLSEYNLLARIQNSVFIRFCKNQQIDFADVSHPIQINTWMRKEMLGQLKQNKTPKLQKQSSHFRSFWAIFPVKKVISTKTGIQKYPPSPRLGQIIVEHRLVTKYSADFYHYRNRNIDVLPITLRVFVGPGPITV